jgi:hypothetical protein
MRVRVGFSLLPPLLLVASVGITLVLLLDAQRIWFSTDETLIAGFVGAAFEDVFGFGFWPSWGLLALGQVAVMAGIWKVVQTRRARYLVLASLSAFAVATALNFHAYEREHTLWVKHAHA